MQLSECRLLMKEIDMLSVTPEAQQTSAKHFADARDNVQDAVEQLKTLNTALEAATSSAKSLHDRVKAIEKRDKLGGGLTPNIARIAWVSCPGFGLSGRKSARFRMWVGVWGNAYPKKKKFKKS